MARYSFLIYLIFTSQVLFANEIFAPKKYKRPLREVSIIVTDDGMYPNKILGYVGEQLRIFVTSTAKKDQCFLLENHEVFLGVSKGKLNEGTVNLENAGRFKYYCPSSNHRGHLTVINKNDLGTKPEEDRTPASVDSLQEREPEPPVPSYWIPRDSEESL